MKLFLSNQELDRKMNRFAPEVIRRSIFSISNCPFLPPTDENVHNETLNGLCMCPGMARRPVQAQANPVFFTGYCLNH